MALNTIGLWRMRLICVEMSEASCRKWDLDITMILRLQARWVRSRGWEWVEHMSGTVRGPDWEQWKWHIIPLKCLLLINQGIAILANNESWIEMSKFYLLNILWVKRLRGTKSQSVLKELQSWEEMVWQTVETRQAGGVRPAFPEEGMPKCRPKRRHGERGCEERKCLRQK